MKINPPWYFECGWWSPWCLIDEWWHRLFDPIPRDDDEDEDGFDWSDAMDTSSPQVSGWLCRKHNRAVERAYYKRHPEHVEEDGYVK